MTSLPIPCRWTGHALEPIGRFKINADRDFVVGQRYMIAEVKDRSSESHRHFFACLTDIWMSLPEHQAGRFPTLDHLRKWALIKTGYANSRQYIATSRAEARRVAAFMRTLDSYSIVTRDQNVVTEWTAKSQAMKAMDEKTFQESKTSVLDYCAGLIGVAPGTLPKETESVA
jgi:hypothetical protein